MGWVTHKLENKNIKVLLSLFWSFWTPHQASQPGDLTKEQEPPGNLAWRPVEFICMTSTGLRETETLILEGTKKILLAPTPRGKQQWPNRWLNQNYLLVLDGLLWRRGLAGAHHRDQGPGSISLGRSPSQFTINVTTDPTGTRGQIASICWVIEKTREF